MDELETVIRATWSAEQVALHGVAPSRDRRGQLLLRLDAFGDDDRADLVGELSHAGEQRGRRLRGQSAATRLRSILTMSGRSACSRTSDA